MNAHPELGPFFECPDCGGDLAIGGHMPRCIKVTPPVSAYEQAAQAVEELDCIYINSDRHPFGGIPADEFSATRRMALQEAVAAIRALSHPDGTT